MFIELHTRSAFSFLSSGSQPQNLAGRAANLGMHAAALIDRDTVAGAVRFHFEARANGIKPIVGSEITMDDGTLLPLVAMDLRGYQNLSKLITTVKLRSKKGEHFATREDIENHSPGLLCFTGGSDGFIHQSLKNGTGQFDAAWLKYVFGDRLYIELQRHHLRNEEYMNQQLLALAYKLHIPYFASNGVYYADQYDRELFDVFTCIKNHRTIYDAGKLLSENSERYLKNERQMLDLFDDYPEAVHVTQDIAARVQFSMDELSYNFPDFKVPPGETMMSFLRTKTRQRAIERYRESKKNVRFQIQSRLDKELAVIEMKKLAGYFLVVSDISDFCKREKILSQGRGSAANSVVCYSLGITAVDPIEHNLLFERFLSEKYEQYPDIDIDLPSGDDRERVIQHVYEKYGRRGAGMTANVICYRGKSAIREVGKTFGFGPEVLGKLSKINSYYETFKGEELHRRLKEEGFDPDRDRSLQKFGELYNRILDFPRHLGQHSGGMVVSWDRLDGVVPLEPASMEGRTIIQWDKDDCEALKIVKIDLLGLGMMAVLRDSIELIREHHGDDMSLYKVPADDPDVYDALQKGDTIGMFQVESRAQIAFLPKSKPANFYDIVVQVAIIRPGPVVGNMLHAYIKRRQGIEKVSYPHPSLEPILKRTMGVPLFQEQLLKMAMDIAGFTGAEAEELRRAMGFKRPDRRMERVSSNLRAGMTRNNIPSDVQEQIVDYTKAFANYGFPESHAYSFALLAYASAYFIIHYRACFTAAMLNNYPLGFYSAATLVKDAQRHGLHFLPIDINRSQYLFTVEDVSTESGSDRPPNSPPVLGGVAPASGDGAVNGGPGLYLVRTGRDQGTIKRELQVRVGLKYVRGLRKEIAEAIVAERDNPSRLSRTAVLRSTAASSWLGCIAMPKSSAASSRLGRIAVRRSSASPSGSPISSAAPPPVRGTASEEFASSARQASPQCKAAEPQFEATEPQCEAAVPQCNPAEPQPSCGSRAENHACSDAMPSSFNPKSKIQNPKSDYTSVEDLVRRVPGINKREIRALSLAGALNFDNTVHRREALWQSELTIQPAGELFDIGDGTRVSSPHVSKGSGLGIDNVEENDAAVSDVDDVDDRSSGALTHVRATDTGAFIKPMEGLELVEADLKKTGITIGKHPMAFLREELAKRGILSAAEARNLKKNQIVSIAGAVIIRQRPMTAKNVVFMTLEDETGHSNFVVMPDTFEKYRAVINQNDYLIIKGIFEERGMLKALTFTPINHFTADVESHNFK